MITVTYMDGDQQGFPADHFDIELDGGISIYLNLDSMEEADPMAYVPKGVYRSVLVTG